MLLALVRVHEHGWKVTWARVKITFRLTVYIAVDSSIKGQNLESNHCLWLNWFWNVNVLGHSSITKLINKNFQKFLKFWCKFKRPKKEKERVREREKEVGWTSFCDFFLTSGNKNPLGRCRGLVSTFESFRSEQTIGRDVIIILLSVM